MVQKNRKYGLSFTGTTEQVCLNGWLFSIKQPPYWASRKLTMISQKKEMKKRKKGKEVDYRYQRSTDIYKIIS